MEALQDVEHRLLRHFGQVGQEVVQVRFQDRRDRPGAHDVQLQTVDGLNKKPLTR